MINILLAGTDYGLFSQTVLSGLPRLYNAGFLLLLAVSFYFPVKGEGRPGRNVVSLVDPYKGRFY